MTAYKLFTHDLRSPIQGGAPVWDGTYPFQLPAVRLDTSADECGAGWSYVTDLAAGFLLVGLWPTGRSSRVVVVEPGPDALTRGDKSRASTLTLVRDATNDEIRTGLLGISQAFGPHIESMVEEQLAWHDALAQPLHDTAIVERSLSLALEQRGLADWRLRQYPRALGALPARAAWDSSAWDTRTTQAAWAAWARTAWARTAWDTRTTQAAWAVLAQAAWTPWIPWTTARDTETVWGALAAWDALIVRYAALCGWVQLDPDLLTVGLRDAYRHGLAMAIPTGPSELGWAMEGDPA